MRILFTVHAFLPTHRGGAELYTFYVAQALRRLGHEVRIVFREDGAGFEVGESIYEGLSCTVIKKSIFWAPNRERWEPGRDARVDGVIAELFESFRPDVVHINHLLGLSAGLPALARLAGIPTVFTLHDYWLFCERFTLLEGGTRICSGAAPEKCAGCVQKTSTRWPDWEPSRRGWIADSKRAIKLVLRKSLEAPGLVRRCHDRAAAMGEVINSTDLFVAPTRFLMDQVMRHGMPSEKIIFCEHGMSDNVFGRSEYDQRPQDTGRLRFGFVGSITYHKGVGVLLDAFRGFEEADLVLYGRRQPFLDSYEDVLAQANVEFRGLLLDEDKSQAFGELDALIVPSIWYENSPLVIHEAFQAGIPVITSDIGGMAELVTDGRNGLHFRVGDAADLRAKIKSLHLNRQTLGALRQGIPEVKGMVEHVTELLEIYARAGTAVGGRMDG
jgi:glycosyltransferase involved in cell wall biosynthesis